jgi:uncharacterized protein (TIGR02266 family)
MIGSAAQPDLGKQVRRSLELLDLALATLKDESPGDTSVLLDIVQRVEQARETLESALNRGSLGNKELIINANVSLGDALQLSGGLSGLSSRQTQSFTAIERANAILLPLVYRSTSLLDISGISSLRSSAKKSVADTTTIPATGDQRRYNRIELETEVTFDGPTNFYTGFSEDISGGGLFLSTYDVRPIGTKIEIAFSLPNGHIINARGQVRWIRNLVEPDEDSKPGMGIMFEELLPEDRVAVDTFIKSRTPIFFDE